MEIIRESEEAAKDYAPLLLDLYENKNGKVKPIKNALEKLVNDAAVLNSQKNQQEILIGYKSDPYPDDEIELNQTEKAIKTLIENNLRFSILTEKAENALQHFDLIKKYKKVRYGLKLLPNSNGQQLNIGEPPLLFGIESLKEANKRGIKTWVDLDPLPEPPLIHDLIRKLYKLVDQWKINGSQFNVKPESKSDWKKFEKDADGLLDSLGIGSPWTEGDIPTRKGNRNILVIAPHGHPGDDKGTYQLARRLADELNCYAIVNKKYRKPKNAGLKAPSLRGCAADLNCWSHVNKFKKIQKQFLEPIQEYKDEFVTEHNALLILHIHGIGNDNRKRVAKLLPEFKDKPADLHLLIGYGQHRDNDKTLLTANVDKLVKPLMTELHKSGVKSAIAPTQHILDKNGEKQWYCGNHTKKLNQKLCEPRNKVQSLQLEIKDGGFRDKSENIKEAALKFAKAVKVVLEVKDKDQNQNAAVPETAASKKHKIYTDFMAIIQRNSESAMLEAGKYLFKTFYKNEIEAAKDDKKKEPLNSLHEYIQDLHGNDPVAPKKSWIYNSVKLAVEYKELKAYLKDDFHMYGNGLNLSQKVLLFTEKDLEKKVQFIRETAAFIEKSGKPLTFVEFKNRFDASRSKQKRNGTRNPSLLSLIGNPEKLIATEISKLLTPESLQKRNLPELKKLHSRASDCISAIQEKIEIQTEYLTRYKEISDTLEKSAKDKAGKSLVKAQPELKTVTPV